MNERDIFLAAVEIEDAAERGAYLDQACEGNEELRSQVESLLQTHEQTSQFLETPAVEADSSVDRTVTTCDADAVPYIGSATLLEDCDMSDEIPLGYLEPSSKEGSLGRLAHYEIEEVLGRGAFGTVLKAFDDKLHRVVAIKVLAPEMAATSPARKRFLREARSSARIRHEHVVAIYGVEDEPIPYLVMEYIPGQTLQQRLDEHGPLDVKDVLRLGKQIADGLAAAHAEGLIHRDIKPGNILLETSVNDHVKITDFGLARTVDDATMTQSGMIAGTPMYMAPEQAHGKKLDQRADLFSFGSVLYQMLSGRPPFRAPSTVAVLKRVTEDTPRPIQEIIPEVPDWMCEIVGHLHAKDPDERYASAKEVSELLAKCLADVEAGRKPKIPAPSQQEDEAAVSIRKPATKPAFARPLAKVAAAVVLLFTVLAITEATEVTQLRPTIVRFFTPRGTLVIETNDPAVMIAIDGEEVTIHGAGVEELSLRPGEYTIAAIKDGQPVKQELVSITRNGRTVVRMTLEPVAAIASSANNKSGTDWPGDAPPPAVESQFPNGSVAPQLAIREYPSNSWIDVIPLIDPKLDSHASQWTGKSELRKEQGHLISVVDEDSFKFVCPLDSLWKTYDLEVEVEVRSRDGRPAFVINLPNANGDSQLMLISTTPGRYYFTFYRDQGVPIVDDIPIDSTQPIKFRVQVRRNNAEDTVAIFLNDSEEPAGTWTGKLDDIADKSKAEFDKTRRISFWIRPNRELEFHSICVRMLDGDTAATIRPVPALPAFEWPADAPPPAIAPFDAAQAAQHQQAWAKYLGVPVEYENSIGMKFRLIPPGEFLMGSTPEEIDAALSGVEDPLWQARIESEGPRHKVVLTQPIYLAVTEVTQTQFERVMGTNPSYFAASGAGRDEIIGLATGDHPVEMVSWNAAAEFSAKLSELEQLEPYYATSGVTIVALDGMGYRLPTESEWEFACRAGAETTGWSSDLDGESTNAGWVRDNSLGRTHAVGELTANPFGLFDVHGNVLEWVQDGWDPAGYAAFADRPAVNPAESFYVGNQHQVVRGSSWNTLAADDRASRRDARVPWHSSKTLGFRVALPVDAVTQRLSADPAVANETTVGIDEVESPDAVATESATPEDDSPTDE